MEVLLQRYLIIALQRFALNSAAAIEITHYPKRLEIRLQKQSNRLLV